MKIVYLTAGAAGMYCGSCMHDNALAAAMLKQGCDIQLVPLYTPIRTDEENVNIDRVFFGGINMYLQQRIPLFRHLPAFADRWLNHPKLIRRVASGSVSVKASELGAMTLSMLRGDHGNQRREVRRLVDWLVDVHLKFKLMPEIVAQAEENARKAHGSFEVLHDFDEGMRGADVVYAKAWGSMLTTSNKEESAEISKKYTDWITDERRMALADEDAIYMHPLPADRNIEVTDAVIDGPQSRVFDQAENRLHVQKAVMALTMR